MSISSIRVVKEILAHLKRTPSLADQLSDTADIIDEVGLDSLEMLQFMLEVEDRMAIQIDFDQMEFDHLRSIRYLVEFLDTMPSRAAAEAQE